MSKILRGQCLCAQVVFEVEDDFNAFYQCHCSQCRQITGSAFASNLFTRKENIRWLKGESLVKRFVDPSRDFVKAFCEHCGCGLPYINKSGTALVVPAGSLLDKVSIQPKANIFTAEAASWLESGAQAPRFEAFVS